LSSADERIESLERILQQKDQVSVEIGTYVIVQECHDIAQASYDHQAYQDLRQLREALHQDNLRLVVSLSSI